MQALFTFLVSPRKVFEDLYSKPRWFVAFTFVVVGMVIKTWLTSCWNNQSFSFQIDVVLITLVILTLFLFLSWSFISVFLFLAVSMIETNRIIVYKKIFSVVSYCGVIFLIGEILNFLLIHAQLVHDSLIVLPHRFPIGLDVLALEKSPHPALAVLLYSINPITAWYLMTLSIGLSTVTGLSKTKARVLSCLIYLLIVGFVIGVLLITGGTRIRIRF